MSRFHGSLCINKDITIRQ